MYICLLITPCIGLVTPMCSIVTGELTTCMSLSLAEFVENYSGDILNKSIKKI